MTIENHRQSLHFQQIENFGEDGTLTVQSPKGRIIQYKPKEVAVALLQKAGEVSTSVMVAPDTVLGSVAAQLSRDLQAVNREQAADALRLLVAGVRVAKELNPGFDAPERSWEEKLTDAQKVIAASGQALVTLEEHQTIARQHDFMQQVFVSAGEALTTGLLGDIGRLSPGAQRQLQLMVSEAMKIALVSTAGQIPSGVVEQGAQNLVLIRQSLAEAAEAGKRAAVDTAVKRVEVARAKGAVRNEDDDRKLRQRLAEQEHQQRLRAAERQQIVNVMKESVSAFSRGAIDFLWGDEGVVVKFADASGQAYSRFVEHVSVPSVAGAGVGGAVGITLGVGLGSAVVESLPMVASSTMQWVALGAPSILMGVGLSATGGWIGAKLNDYLERWERKKLGQNGDRDEMK